MITDMKKIVLLFISCLVGNILAAQTKPEETEVWEPEPKVITGVVGDKPPSDAIILFDGSGFDAWRSTKTKGVVEWNREGEAMVVKAGKGAIETKQSFGDIQLHLEWRAPTVIEGEGQGRGNSGVFLQSRYEVQVLDSYDNRTYSNGQAGSVYKQHIPLVNAMNNPGEWQVYDIIYKAPFFNESGEKVSSGYVTVLHNGVLVQNHVEILGTTEYIGPPKNVAHDKAPLMLQDHGNPVAFRNIWVREL